MDAGGHCTSAMPEITVRAHSVSGELMFASGFVSLSPMTTLSELNELLFGDDVEEQLFVEQFLINSGAPLLIQGAGTLAELEGAESGLLDLQVLPQAKCPELELGRIPHLEKVRDYVRRICILGGKEEESLAPIAQKFPNLEHLEVRVDDGQRKAKSSYWYPLKSLTQLKSLAVMNHHGFRHSGELTAEFLQSLAEWGADGPQLTSLKYEGAMDLGLGFFKDWVDKVETLSPDLHTLSIFYWFANPALVNDVIFQKITKKWRRLKFLHLGSGCGLLTDKAFLHFRDNPEGIQAGLELEKLDLVCCTGVYGDDWLVPSSIKRNLPKLKEFELSASRHFCTCGNGGCGSHQHVVQWLEEAGVKFNHHTTHW